MLAVKKILVFATLAISLIPSVHAHCPVCTAAVGAAAISAKYYGMDVSIIGLLIGAFGISTGLWIGLKVKRQYFKFQFTIIVLASFLLTVIPLLVISNETVYFPLLLFGESGAILNRVYWVNKLLFGSVIGGLVTSFAYLIHIYIKKQNGKVLFPFQGVAITLAFLALSGLSLYLALGV